MGSAPVGTLLALGALSLLPFVFMATTSFVKLSVVLSVLRNALGTPEVPSGMIVTALAAILTLYVMAPVGERMAQAAAVPSARVDLEAPLSPPSRAAAWEAFELGKVPLAAFLAKHAGERERALFVDLAKQARPGAAADAVTADDFMVLLPAFLITELKEAFQIAFMVFLPFLVIDLVVANILMALGMTMLTPSTVALPFKLLLFVLVDGWYVLSQALIAGYL